MPQNSSFNESAVNLAGEPAAAQNEPEARSPFLKKIRAVRHRMPLAVRLPLAILFLAIGVLGGFIPILQGWVFVLAAFWLLFPDQAEQLIEKIKVWLAKLKKKS
jgi:hypothetical protein